MKQELTEEIVIKRAQRSRRVFTSESCIVNKHLTERVIGCDLKEQRLDFEFDMSKDFANANGVVHGGLIAWIADMTMAAALAVYKGEYHGATIDMSVDYINPVSTEGKIVVKAYCVRIGNSVRRARAEFYSGDTVMVTAAGNYTGKTMTGGRMVSHIDEETWSVEDGSVRAFILNGKEKTAVIDSGAGRKDISRIAYNFTLNSDFVINTHADPDHIFGNDMFKTEYMNERDFDLYRKNGGKGDPVSVKEGDILDLGGRPLEIIETPGHTKGSICILDVNSRALYAGDTVQNAAIYMSGDGRSLRDYAESLKKLISMKDRYDVIYCCHGDVCLTPDFLPGLLSAAEALIGGTAGPGYEVCQKGKNIRRYDFGYCSFYTL